MVGTEANSTGISDTAAVPKAKAGRHSLPRKRRSWGPGVHAIMPGEQRKVPILGEAEPGGEVGWVTGAIAEAGAGLGTFQQFESCWYGWRSRMVRGSEK